MYEEQTYEVILERMLARVSDTLDKRPSSPIYDTESPLAIELQILYIELENMIQNSYGDTAAREFLFLIAKDRGLAPNPASKAVLKGIFTPATIDVTGQRFNVGEMIYVATEKISDGEYQMQCEQAGAIGNQFLGQIVPLEYIDGLQTANLTEVLIPGEDEEDTEVFRQRYFSSFNEQAFGGNHADYVTKVNSISGVGACKVKRVWNGDIKPAEMIPSASVQSWFNSFIGTVSNAEVKAWLTAVYNAALLKKLTVGGTVRVIIVDSDDYGSASSALVQTVQTTLDPTINAGEGVGIAPIGHVVSVASAQAVSLTIKVNITFDAGYNWTNRQAAIEDAINSYLLELRSDWAQQPYLVVRLAQLETHILGVPGIIDLSDTTINGSASNLVLEWDEVPILGGVSA